MSTLVPLVTLAGAVAAGRSLSPSWPSRTVGTRRGHAVETSESIP